MEIPMHDVLNFLRDHFSLGLHARFGMKPTVPSQRSTTVSPAE
jgi:hypothetical protein